jgi:hypothetical protein
MGKSILKYSPQKLGSLEQTASQFFLFSKEVIFSKKVITISQTISNSIELIGYKFCQFY